MPDPKKLAQQAAKVARDEGLEILKAAGEQIKSPPSQAPESQEAQEKKIEEEKVKASDLRRLEALEVEMKQIRQEKEKEYQERVTQQFPRQEAQPAPVEEPSTKPKRGLLKGPQARAEKARRATELVKMPSG